MPEGTPASKLDVVNDAAAYGVTVIPAEVVPGQVYWKIVTVHHLTPEQNRGNHHIFVDVLDEDDKRIYGAQVKMTWQTGSAINTIDKPGNEPGTNFPMWKNQVCDIEIASGLPSDRAIGIHTSHPDEGFGNTCFHHSFFIEFKKAVYDGAIKPENGAIEGRVKGGAGMTLALLQGDEVLRRTTVGPDEFYRFEKLAAGIYSLQVEGTEAIVRDIGLDGNSVVVIDMSLGGGEHGQSLNHYVLFGKKDAPGTQTNFVLAQDYILRNEAACGFSVEEALSARLVTIMGDVRAVSEADERRLIGAGVQVRRISGDSYTVEEILSHLP